MNLVSEILTDSASHRLNDSAVHCNGRWFTFSQIDSQASAIADALIEMPINLGERVAILWENSTEYIAAHFGVVRAGAVEVSLNSDLSPESLVELLNHCEVQLLFVSARQLRRIGTSLRLASTVRHLVTDAADIPPTLRENGISVTRLDNLIAQPNPQSWVVDRDPDDLASIVYTSGSTGHPEGGMLTHRNLRSNAEAVVDYLGIHSSDRMMVVLPFHYIYGRSLLYTHYPLVAQLCSITGLRFPALWLRRWNYTK